MQGFHQHPNTATIMVGVDDDDNHGEEVDKLELSNDERLLKLQNF